MVQHIRSGGVDDTSWRCGLILLFVVRPRASPAACDREIRKSIRDKRVATCWLLLRLSHTHTHTPFGMYFEPCWVYNRVFWLVQNTQTSRDISRELQLYPFASVARVCFSCRFRSRKNPVLIFLMEKRIRRAREVAGRVCEMINVGVCASERDLSGRTKSFLLERTIINAREWCGVYVSTWLWCVSDLRNQIGFSAASKYIYTVYFSRLSARGRIPYECLRPVSPFVTIRVLCYNERDTK